MPELPEVQTIISDLNKKIKGDTIVGFWSDWKKTIKNISAKKFGEEIQGRKILGARRIGKNILIDLSGNPRHTGRDKKTIYIHLKMTGHLLVKSKIQNPNAKIKIPLGPPLKKGESQDYFGERVNQYVHHIWFLKPQIQNHKSQINSKSKIQNPKFYDTTLEFSDLRKFGKIVLADTDKIKNLKEIKNLGIDVLDKKFTLKKFEEILEKRRNSPIGIILMNQNLLAGIGNIYRSEILYDAGIIPTRKINKLKSEEIKNLYNSIRKILKKAVKMRGTSDSDYRDTAGALGGFQKVLKVYRHDGKKCRKCGTIIKRIKLGQRSAYVCEYCQR